ncbi:trypsin-like serine protease [Amycolatopsis sp. CA-128772]|uniref:S1 family peptidase n=1 Tax=Amycolatopsis sp. CA-128772 TaxID=2073159 RepID=UPI000CD0007B|nr:trypsin-like serine protease [Amycolatopsis sp. CA-128772]
MQKYRGRFVRAAILVAIASAALTALAGAPAQASPAPTGNQPSIIDGSTAQNPGYITRFNGHSGDYTYYCTSTLIASRWVLTAKHCLFDNDGNKMQDIDLYVGSNQANGGRHVKAASTYFYVGGDLALLELNATGGSTYSRLANSRSDARVGNTVTVYGWGSTVPYDEGQHQSPGLKKANVRISSVNSNDTYGGPSIQANYLDGGPAGGDSGGPMIANGIQVGVSSTSDRSNVCDYASVSAGRDWIRQISGV